MNNKNLLSLQEIFNQKLFRIPDYQRGYSWGENQLEDFWEDLENLRENQIHYTGLLTVEATKEKFIDKTFLKEDKPLLNKNYKPFYIVDGQQRITTAIILINLILENFDENEELIYETRKYWREKFLYKTLTNLGYNSYIFGYEKEDPSLSFFITKILRQKYTPAGNMIEGNLYTQNLNYAHDFFKLKTQNLKKENLVILFEKIINQIKFNFYEIDNELDVYVTFETMNNRGKSLSNLELLKNRLIYMTTLLKDKENTELLRLDINETWKTIYSYLGKDIDNPLSDDDFLRNHKIMYFNSLDISYSDFLLKNHFIPKKILKNDNYNPMEIREYIINLGESIKTWYSLNLPINSEYSQNIKDYLFKLKNIGFGGFKPLLLIAFLNYHKESEPQLLKLLKSIERYVFLIFKVSGRRSNTGEREFYRLAFELHKKDCSLEEIINKIEEMAFWQNEEGNEGGWLDLSTFSKNIYRNFTEPHGGGFYSWDGLKYFLYEYELNLKQISKGENKIDIVDFQKRKKEDSIEHVYPQNREKWKPLDSKEKKHKIVLNSLGNLVPISISKNSELKNNVFEFKKKHIGRNGNETGFFNGSYSEIEICQYSKWGKEEILERGLKLLDFFEKRWEVSFEEWGIDKEKFLLGEKT